MSATNLPMLFIINPSSGSGRCGKLWPKVSVELSGLGINFDFRFSERPGHIQQIVDEAVALGYRTLVSFGGDGTISALVNGVMAQKTVGPTEILLSHFPAGTGNDWGRTFNIPTSTKKWAEMWLRGRTYPHDVGVMNFANGRTAWFVNIVGMAYDSRVVRVIDDMRAAKSFIQGKMLYQYVILRELIGFNVPTLTLRMDEGELTLPVFNLAVGICRYNGDGMMPTRDADPSDGLLDLMIVRDMPRWRVVKDLPLLRTGNFEGHPFISTHRTSFLEVLAHNGTDLVEADGDSVGQTPVRFSVAQQALRVVVNEFPFSTPR